MNEQPRIEPKQRIHHFAKWFLAGGWQPIASLLALYLLWVIAGELNSIGGELARVYRELNSFPKN